jgi:glycosyltransferase involved in cell wall biosynthesis
VNVTFVNENTLGHASYLLPFVTELRNRPELGIIPQVIDATPLPPRLSRHASFTIRGLRRWDLDFHTARWRTTVSRYVRDRLATLVKQKLVDAIVVNTQSVALALDEIADHVPVFVCLDATFHQLCRSGWFAPNSGSRFFLPLTARTILRKERVILDDAAGLYAWSDGVRDSLIRDYGCRPEQIDILPPSTGLHRLGRKEHPGGRPRILFIGGDFRRKGGHILLDCYRRWFSTTCDLDIVTHSGVAPESGVSVHHDVKPLSETWMRLWQKADIFVFPSSLETFGIVLLEALGFEVPVISSDAGAARFILDHGNAGWLLPDLKPETLASVLNEVISKPAEARQRASAGRIRLERYFDLAENTRALAQRLKASAWVSTTARTQGA